MLSRLSRHKPRPVWTVVIQEDLLTGCGSDARPWPYAQVILEM
jgi:hypothetical protein